ncbi:hypothetical protein ACC757_37605, partial [Rhizobium ruizarguesonis]
MKTLLFAERNAGRFFERYHLPLLSWPCALHSIPAMLFRRRTPAGFKEKMRELLWPRKGFLRPVRYLKRRV